MRMYIKSVLLVNLKNNNYLFILLELVKKNLINCKYVFQVYGFFFS